MRGAHARSACTAGGGSAPRTAPAPAVPTTAPAGPHPQIGGQAVSFGLSAGGLGQMEAANSELAAGDFDSLRSQLASRGFLFFRGLLPEGAVAAARRSVVQTLSAGGVLAPPESECGDELRLSAAPEEDYHLMLRRLNVEHDPAVRALGSDPVLLHLFDSLFGTPSMALDWKRVRTIVPGDSSGFHMDKIYTGEGTDRLLTCWVPLGPADFERGGLVIAAESCSADGPPALLRRTYGEHNVDSGKINGDGTLCVDPHEASTYGRLLTSEFIPGDCVIFNMQALHGSTTNTTAKNLRLSVDVRFQPANELVDTRWMGKPQDLGYRVATYQNRHCLPGACTMSQAKDKWGLRSCSSWSKL